MSAYKEIDHKSLRYRLPASAETERDAVARRSEVLRARFRNDSFARSLRGQAKARVIVLEGENTLVTEMPQNVSTVVLDFDTLQRHFSLDLEKGVLNRSNKGARVDLGATRAIVITNLNGSLQSPIIQFESEDPAEITFRETDVRTLVLLDAPMNYKLRARDGLVSLIAHTSVADAFKLDLSSNSLNVLSLTIESNSVTINQQNRASGIRFEVPNLVALYLGTSGPYMYDPIEIFANRHLIDDNFLPKLSELRAFATNRRISEISWVFDFFPLLAFVFALPEEPRRRELPDGVKLIQTADPHGALLDFVATSPYMSGVEGIFIPIHYRHAPS